MDVTILYFASLREAIGHSEERVHLPPSVRTPAEVIAWLVKLGPHYAVAFSDFERLRCAVDQVVVPMNSRIESAQEIAFFPPVTGG
jgi:sulfur-carrier protein